MGLLVFNLLSFLSPWLIVEMQLPKVFSIGITLVDVHLNWLTWFLFLIPVGGLLVILIGCMILLSPFLDVVRTSMSPVSFLTQPNCGINAKCFPLNHDRYGLKFRVHRHPLSLDSFQSAFYVLFFFLFFFFLKPNASQWLLSLAWPESQLKNNNSEQKILKNAIKLRHVTVE